MMAVAACGISVLSGVAHAAEAGGVAGSFAVSPSGGASYGIPITIPPGTAGLVPNLSMAYTSQAGDGLMGVRWRLEGLSSVTRCSKTLVQDNAKEGISYTNADKYCLDGQRLIPVPATIANPCASSVEYRTERESFIRVVSCGTVGTTGPAYFMAWTRSGQVMEFGRTADSAIEAKGKTAIRLWAVNKVYDAKGNYLTASYDEDVTNGQFYPARIDYTGNSTTGLVPYNSVRFVYTPRTDLNPTYEAGSMIQGTKLLSFIQTYARGYTAPVKEYRLEYGEGFMTKRFRLTKVTECDGTGATAKCLNPTYFNWSQTTGYGASGAAGFYKSVAWQGHGVSNTPGTWVDLNGDGLSDYITSNLGGTSYVSLAKWMGSETGSNYVNQTWAEPIALPRGATWLDMDADGKTDMVSIDANGVMSIAYSTGTGFANPKTVNLGTTAGVGAWSFDGISHYTCNAGGQVTHFATNGTVIVDIMGEMIYNPGALYNKAGTFLVAPSDPYGLWNGAPVTFPYFCPDKHSFADLNGDGRPDYIAIAGSTHHIAMSTDTAGVYVNQTWQGHAISTSGIHWVDLNGDGKADYVTNDANGNHYVSLSTGTGYVNQTWTGHGISTSGAHWTDLNGDGKSDYVTNDANGNHYVSISTGTGYAAPKTWTGHGISTSGAHWVDLNGDGRSDYVTDDANGNHYVSLSKGTGYVTAQTWPGHGIATTGANWVDINGDGRADYATSDTAGTHSISFSANAKDITDGITSIVNGLGATTTVSYLPLTHGNTYGNYLVETTGVYPVVDIQLPIFTVDTVTNSDGVGGDYVSNYRYTGAKVHLKGGGFLGFRVVNSIDAQTGIKNRSSYRQDYPYHGLIQNITKLTASNGTLSQTVNTWNFTTNAAWSAQYHVPKLTKSIDTSYDFATSGTGALLNTLTTDSVFDGYGNATQVTTASTGGYSKVTDSTYLNNPAQWILGRQTGVTVTSTAPGTIPTITPTPGLASFSISALSADKAEGNAGATPFTFTVARTGNANSAASVNWVVAGTGAHPANTDDFVGNVFPSGTLSFVAGETSKVLTVNVQGNTIFGGDDEFTVTLSAPSNGSLGTLKAGGVIRNDDTMPPPVISIAALAADKLEGDTGTTPFTFTVSRSGMDLSMPSTVKYAVTGSGTVPANAADFVGGVLPTGTLTFATGQTTQTLTVNVQGDPVFETDDGFTVTLSQATDATLGTTTAAGVIRNETSDAFFYTKVFTANASDYNLRSQAVTAGWNQTAPLNATVTVNAGIVVSSTSTATAALTIDGTYPTGSVVALTIQSGAYVVGKGGAGGVASLSQVGEAGGVALKVASTGATVRVTNNGTIGGGGGGGGSIYGMYGWIMSCDNGHPQTVSLAGGGGAGYGAGAVNAGGLTTGGAGAVKSGASSGAGGALGAAGVASYRAGVCGDPGMLKLGGAGGAAVVGNANVTWVVVGTRLGALQ